MTDGPVYELPRLPVAQERPLVVSVHAPDGHKVTPGKWLRDLVVFTCEPLAAQVKADAGGGVGLHVLATQGMARLLTAPDGTVHLVRVVQAVETAGR